MDKIMETPWNFKEIYFYMGFLLQPPREIQLQFSISTKFKFKYGFIVKTFLFQAI